VIALGIWVRHYPHHSHTYTIERVKDVNGNDAFLRIDVENGEECAIGHGWGVVRPGQVPTDTYLIPFCHTATK